MKILINAHRNGYSSEGCGKTLTVKELKELLEDFEDDTEIFLKHDGGYTYGSINANDFENEEEEEEE